MIIVVWFLVVDLVLEKVVMFLVEYVRKYW